MHRGSGECTDTVPRVTETGNGTAPIHPAPIHPAPTYPGAERTDVTELLHGHPVADPVDQLCFPRPAHRVATGPGACEMITQT